MDLEAYKGDDIVLPLEFVGVDLTGATIYVTAKADYDNVAADTDAPIKVDWTTHSDPTNGKTDVLIPSSQTENMAAGKYKWDARLKTNAGKISTPITGTLTIKPVAGNRASA